MSDVPRAAARQDRYDSVANQVRALFHLPRAVWLLGWVSFFTDTASEMVYPLLPLFLTRALGASAMSIGVIEGVAEAANSVLKVLSGWLADRWRAPKPLVLTGYTFSSAVRPLIALVTSWPQVLLLRFADRTGKGIRGAPRDAMLAAFAEPQSRGRVFGFNRAMDHAGAVLGPLLASAFLYFSPNAYRALFALTLIPGLIVVLILLRVPNPATAVAAAVDVDRPSRDPLDGSARHAKREFSALSWTFYGAMGVIFLFTLGNATDAFLLLRLDDLGVAPFWIPLLWSGLHVVKVCASLAGGELSDRFGRRSLIALGWITYALVYAGFGLLETPGIVIAIFLSYGLYFGLTEGVEKAWVADMAPRRAHGTAFGIYNAVLGAGSLAASLLFGALWTRVSPDAAFLTGAALALGAAALLPLVTGTRADESRTRLVAPASSRPFEDERRRTR
jgi:MFS family permease